MSSPEPDAEDTTQDPGEDVPGAAGPTGSQLPPTNPGGALDALEERALDDDKRPSARVDQRGDDGSGAAFDVDLDPEDQGRADTGEEQSG